MQLGRVIGTVVATVRVDGLDGVKFLVVQPLDKRLRPTGSAMVAAPGELVYYVSSREGSLALPEKFVPVDEAIVGIVDDVAPVAGEESS